jgi:guanine nucleotide-binding protein subunit alpha
LDRPFSTLSPPTPRCVQEQASRGAFLTRCIIQGGGQVDQFEQVPLERYFPEYTGSSDINKAAKHTLWKFIQANRTRLSVYPQYAGFLLYIHPVLTLVGLTQATNATNL